ncbi:hypothetical protein NC652_006890 [Populus alba x Populus x berolinensis]|nr:hypothetical protein NC652_006890 [Populus alba x Populus x berolinensis]
MVCMVTCCSCGSDLKMNIFYKEKVMCSVKMYKQESDALSVLTPLHTLDMVFRFKIFARIFEVFHSRALSSLDCAFRRLLFSQI